jgi:ribosome biogenesis SPOUT family RNA methylase Rps3
MDTTNTTGGSRYYAVEHMETFFYDWCGCEYQQMQKYLKKSPQTRLLLSNFGVIRNYNKSDDTGKENKKNLDTFLSENDSVYDQRCLIMDEPFNNLINQENNKVVLKDPKATGGVIEIPFDRVCLLDMKADKVLSPDDKGKFDLFLFGGILGDIPSKDRTSELRKDGYVSRHLGEMQMTTDTAVLVSKIIVEDGVEFKDIPFIDEPEVNGEPDEEGIEQTVQMEGFRYVSDEYDIEAGRVGKRKSEEERQPIIHEYIKNVLLFKDLDLDQDFFN